MSTEPEKKDENMVMVDARIVAAAAGESAEKGVEHIDQGVPLVTGHGKVELGTGLRIAYDEKSQTLEAEIGGKTATMTKLELWQFVFSICDPDLREQIMPVRQTEVMEYTKVHTVQLKKDMRRGEIMKVRCITHVPTTVVEGLAGMVERGSAKSSIILPN
jgi:hypothetical protein